MNIIETRKELDKAYKLFKSNPSAANFRSLENTMLRYQELTYLEKL